MMRVRLIVCLGEARTLAILDEPILFVFTLMNYSMDGVSVVNIVIRSPI